LEARVLPASLNLLWVGPANGTWSGNNWVDLGDPNPNATVAPQAGDSLVFDPSLRSQNGKYKGTDFDSVDNLRVDFTNLTMDCTFTHTLKFNGNMVNFTGTVTMNNGTLDNTPPPGRGGGSIAAQNVNVSLGTFSNTKFIRT